MCSKRTAVFHSLPSSVSSHGDMARGRGRNICKTHWIFSIFFCKPSSSFVLAEAQLGRGKERGGQAPRDGGSFNPYLFVGHLHTISSVFFKRVALVCLRRSGKMWRRLLNLKRFSAFRLTAVGSKRFLSFFFNTDAKTLVEAFDSTKSNSS